MTEESALYRATFAGLEQNLSSFLEEVRRAQPPNEAGGFQRSSFWENISTAVQKVGFECNKIGLLWVKSPPPAPKDMAAVCSLLEMACVYLSSCYLSLPSSEGSLLRLQLRDRLVDILEAGIKFAKTLQTTIGLEPPAAGHPLLPDCGLVMKYCYTLHTFPRTNREACTVKLKSDIHTIKDALRELEEARDDETFLDEDCEDRWTEADKRIMVPLLGIVKAGGALMNKTSETMRKYGRCDVAEEIAEYDAAAERLARICPAVDDLALSLYPPLDWQESQQLALNLKSILEDSMTFLSTLHFMQLEEAGSWLAFVRKAVDHNVAEIQRIFIEAGLASLQLTEADCPVVPP